MTDTLVLLSEITDRVNCKFDLAAKQETLEELEINFNERFEKIDCLL
jgi:hypothetical protein